jgi:hypothetical protein
MIRVRPPLDDHKKLVSPLDVHRLAGLSRNDDLIFAAEFLNSHDRCSFTLLYVIVQT